MLKPSTPERLFPLGYEQAQSVLKQSILDMKHQNEISTISSIIIIGNQLYRSTPLYGASICSLFLNITQCLH